MLCLRGVILLFVMSISLSIAIPTTPNNSPNFEISPAQQESSNLRLRRASLLRPDVSSYTTRPLQTRDWKVRYLDEGWALYLSTYDQYHWIENAAATLEEFFTSIAEHAAGPWLHQAPLKAFIIQRGALSLEFRSDLIEIPWNFVASFAQGMLNSVQTGFVGAFEVILDHIISGGAVYVKLRTTLNELPAAAAA